MPGPVCYGKGGEAPTITDANVLLGRLDASRIPGIPAPAPRERVSAAFERELGAALGLDPAGCADAVLRVVNLRMAGAIRLISVAKGHDTRDFTLFAFGGAGPLHAADVALGYYTPEEARESFAVAIDTASDGVDEAATRALRSALGGASPSSREGAHERGPRGS